MCASAFGDDTRLRVLLQLGAQRAGAYFARDFRLQPVHMPPLGGLATFDLGDRAMKLRSKARHEPSPLALRLRLCGESAQLHAVAALLAGGAAGAGCDAGGG